jgi:phage terminase small subunit
VTGTSALSEAERIFVDVFIGNGGQATAAAIAAGLPEASASVAACRMLCKRRVADAILARCQTFLQTAIPVALKALFDIAGDEQALRKDRIKAATCILEHGGMAAPKGGVQVNVGVQVNGEQAQRLIGSVWSAKQARLSGIADGMSDTLQSDLRDIEQLAIGPPADPPGGDQLQGPGAGTGPVPVSPSAQPPLSAVSDGADDGTLDGADASPIAAFRRAVEGDADDDA